MTSGDTFRHRLRVSILAFSFHNRDLFARLNNSAQVSTEQGGSSKTTKAFVAGFVSAGGTLWHCVQTLARNIFCGSQP